MPYLPGQRVTTIIGELMENSCCGKNGTCTNDPTHKVVGETDSFGSEFLYFCDECNEENLKHAKENPLIDQCEWCGTPSVKLKHYRAPDEINGPVYEVCADCISKSVEYHSD